MGEGWSDWFAMLLTLKGTDAETTSHVTGNYVTNQGGGIRRQPYNTNMSVDPLTYASYNGASYWNYEIHRAGEMWCSVLWDMTWRLIDRWGHSADITAGYTNTTSGGEAMALRLVLDSLKILPRNPTFLIARTGILMADQTLTGGANQLDIWNAFARRGLGLNATDGGTSSPPFVTEDCSSPNLGLIAPWRDTIGFYDPATSLFWLRNDNSSGGADLVPGFGTPNGALLPVTGDWNRDGIDTLGLYSQATSVFSLRNSNDTGVANIAAAFGTPGAGLLPVVGDWDGDGTTTIGVYDPVTSHFILSNSNTAPLQAHDVGFGSPGAGWLPIAGDWNADGVTTIGLYDPATSYFYLSNSNAAPAAAYTFGFGTPGADLLPIAGDWNRDGTDNVGLYQRGTTPTYFLRYSHTTGTANVQFGYGWSNTTFWPVAGDWNGPQPLSQLLAAAETSTGAPASGVLSQVDVNKVVPVAIARWAAGGASDVALARMRAASFAIRDLQGSTLGAASDSTIYLDRDGAGHGWFIDGTPNADQEFSPVTAGRQLAGIDPRAVDRIDLLTVVEHELGHIAGLQDVAASFEDVMSGALPTGVRRVVGAA